MPGYGTGPGEKISIVKYKTARLLHQDYFEHNLCDHSSDQMVDDTGIEPVTPTMSKSRITVLRVFCYLSVFTFTLKHCQEYQGMTVGVR